MSLSVKNAIIPSYSFHFKIINYYSKRSLKTRLPLIISDINKIRNIGIIAHIDAGKTTLTEQLLYQTGITQSVGFVDEGSTITDFMEIERERGITIQSASISSLWKNHRINLIDTPGHVDFTVEVERSLRVLDGAVTVLDASAGVQAQTLTVWRQANKFNLPLIFFINKMDKPCADLNFCVNSIEERLNIKVIPIVLPFFNSKNGNLEGFIDILNNLFLNFTKLQKDDIKFIENNNFEWIQIQKNSQIEKISFSGFEDICLNIADVDSEFEKQITKHQNLRNIPKEIIIKALRKNTISRKLSPIACGSALHCSLSVLPVMDMIINFLPNPNENNFKNNKINDEIIKSCGIVFKVSHDKKEGQLNYVRLFKGDIKIPSINNKCQYSLINANKDECQNNYKIFTPFSDYLQSIEKVEDGNIAVFTGLNNTKTGDTLIICNSSYKNKSFAHFALEGIDSPSPVFSCTIESPTMASEQKFLKALSELLVEDPSLQIREDPITGQKILEGMGELQIEVLRERLLREYKLDVFIGPLRIGYRESPTEPAEHSETIEDSLSQKFQRSCNSLKLYIEPLVKNDDIIVESGFGIFSGIELSLESENIEEIEIANQILSKRPELLRAINDGCSVALFNGPKMGFSVTNVKIFLKSFTFSGRIQPTLLSACASRCLSNALKKSEINIFEPLMKIEVSIISGISGFPDVDIILNELSKRRSRIISIDNQKKIAIIIASIPLSETIGLSKILRTISSGLASFNLEQKGYQIVESKNVYF
ncbi:hypothetical protein ACQ4LE_002695 [Meloidogyne hapla]|uniref:Tr-type G domain-containing protein n=1 Tax=Meloidogyne hapla TaxID=6305 RepID=A0A1I8AXZ2_MELHA